LRILEARVISLPVEQGVTVICAGGGGIPVIQRADGNQIGVEAVVDKNHASALRARLIGADMLTDVAAVALGRAERARHPSCDAPYACRLRFSCGFNGPEGRIRLCIRERDGRICCDRSP
jgi:carbamate kinase